MPSPSLCVLPTPTVPACAPPGRGRETIRQRSGEATLPQPRGEEPVQWSRAPLRALTGGEMASADTATADRAMRRYAHLQERLAAAGGYAAESEAAQICASLGLPERVLGQELGTLSGGQRRRVELARILFSGSQTLLLDEPTNHLDADSIAWLREFLRTHKGGLVVISHDVGLLLASVNRVF